MSLQDFVRESNLIEGIRREPTDIELAAHRGFLDEYPTVGSIADLALLLTGGKGRLRVSPGMDVRVGPHVPPHGGPTIEANLRALLANADRVNPWDLHIEYETLHPFMDGNGRTGRALWLWCVGGEAALNDLPPLGFLHAFYYQTLQYSRLAP